MPTRIYTFFFSGVIVAAMFVAASFTFAQTQDTSSSSASSTVLLQESTSTATTTVQASSASTTLPDTAPASGLSSESQLRIINLAANISNKSEAYRNRLSLIANRAESRMLKLESEGYEVGNVRNFLAEARNDLLKAENTLSDIDVRVTQFVTAADYQVLWEDVRNIFITEKSDLESVKALLVNAVDEMYRVQAQDIRVGVMPETASSTQNATATTESL